MSSLQWVSSASGRIRVWWFLAYRIDKKKDLSEHWASCYINADIDHIKTLCFASSEAVVHIVVSMTFVSSVFYGEQPVQMCVPLIGGTNMEETIICPIAVDNIIHFIFQWVIPLHRRSKSSSSSQALDLLCKISYYNGSILVSGKNELCPLQMKFWTLKLRKRDSRPLRHEESR